MLTLWLLVLSLPAWAAVGGAPFGAALQRKHKPKVAEDEGTPPPPRRRTRPRRGATGSERARATPSPTPRPTPRPTPQPATQTTQAQPRTTTPAPAEVATVTFATGAPQADVFLVLDDQRLQSLGQTVEDGRLTVELPPGSYTFTASHPGYRANRKYVVVRPGENVLDFNLTNHPLKETMSAAAKAIEEVIGRFLDPAQTDDVKLADWQLVEREASEQFALKPFDRQIQAQALFARGQIAYLGGDYDAALNSFNSAARVLPDSALAYYGLGNAYLAAEQFPAADRAFRRAIEINDELAMAHRGAGDAQARMGKAGDALKYYERASALGYTSTGMTANVARALMWQKRWAQALIEWQRVLKARPRADVLIAIGDCHAELKEFYSAAEAYRNALALDQRSALAQYKYGEVMYELRDYRATADALKRALDLDPNGADINLERARSLASRAAEKLRKP